MKTEIVDKIISDAVMLGSGNNVKPEAKACSFKLVS